jgi:hypothetical protein
MYAETYRGGVRCGGTVRFGQPYLFEVEQKRSRMFCLWFAAQSACCKKHCLNDELNPPQSPLEEDE